MVKKNNPHAPSSRESYLLSALSGILLTLAYPDPGWGFLAWAALVPLLLVLSRCKTRSQAFGYGWITGLVFFGASMHWMTHVTTVGWMLLAVMESVYLAVFAWLAFLGIRSSRPILVQILWIALAWTVTELIRSEMPVLGFGWNLLAYSQASYLSVIQVANIVGAYGLGTLVALVNGALFYLWVKRGNRRTVTSSIVLMAVVVTGLLGYGKATLERVDAPKEYLRVSVLQGNIPQSVKWHLMAKEKIIEIYERLTQISALEQPDLIIWPEASFPGYFNRDLEAERISRLAAEVHAPLLVGGLHWVSDRELYNSAYFLEKDGAQGQRYDKLRLVPFGEYIPFKSFLGWLTPVADALGISDFSSGSDTVLFRWAREDWPFGVLICFEDVFTGLARELADRDAKFLTVITNDAWFGKTGAPFQHLQASIFRAVENGLPVVRAANTGVSAFISYRGRVLGTVSNERGEATFVAGQKTLDLPLMTERTFYRQGGFLFPFFALAFFLILGVSVFRRKK